MCDRSLHWALNTNQILFYHHNEIIFACAWRSLPKIVFQVCIHILLHKHFDVIIFFTLMAMFRCTASNNAQLYSPSKRNKNMFSMLNSFINKIKTCLDAMYTCCGFITDTEVDYSPSLSIITPWNRLVGVYDRWQHNLRDKATGTLTRFVCYYWLSDLPALWLLLCNFSFLWFVLAVISLWY